MAISTRKHEHSRVLERRIQSIHDCIYAWACSLRGKAKHQPEALNTTSPSALMRDSADHSNAAFHQLSSGFPRMGTSDLRYASDCFTWVYIVDHSSKRCTKAWHIRKSKYVLTILLSLVVGKDFASISCYEWDRKLHEYFLDPPLSPLHIIH